MDKFINKVIMGDCLIKLKELDDNSIDSIVTDPPYHLVSIVKRFGKENSAPAKFGTDGAFSRVSKGFMGKDWDGVNEDGIGIAQKVELWKECLRVLKPGGYLLSFGGTRTYHRMAVAIEDAGFEVRDMIEWVYGSGFPKSLNIGKAVDRLQGNEREVVGSSRAGSKERNGFKGDMAIMPFETETIDLPLTKGTSEWEGWGTALKPAHEPICMARKPLAEKTVAENVLKWGTGGINIDESRVDYVSEYDKKHQDDIQKGQLKAENGKFFGGNGQSISSGNLQGRFPANLIHDNSEEVVGLFPNSKGGGGHSSSFNPYGGNSFNTSTTKKIIDKPTGGMNDSGSASRFFKSIIYQAKASKSERNKGCEELGTSEKFTAGNYSQSPTCKDCEKTLNGTNDHSKCSGEVYYKEMESKNTKNNHPTVKPIALMEYLIKMVTPKGGIVLDPFMGSGTTGIACRKLNYGFIGIELEPDYITIAKARIDSIKAVQEKLL